MLLSRLNFSSELMICGHWWLAEINEMLCDILFSHYFVDVFPRLKHWLSNHMRQRCSVMFICVKTSTEEGMITFTCAPLCTSLRCAMAQKRELELIAAARVNACVGFIPARFWTVPESALRGVYTAICHTTSKTVKTEFIIWISWEKKHAYRTEKPILKWFCKNTCTITPSIYTRAVNRLRYLTGINRMIVINRTFLFVLNVP